MSFEKKFFEYSVSGDEVEAQSFKYVILCTIKTLDMQICPVNSYKIHIYVIFISVVRYTRMRCKFNYNGKIIIQKCTVS